MQEISEECLSKMIGFIISDRVYQKYIKIWKNRKRQAMLRIEGKKSSCGGTRHRHNNSC